MCSQCVEIRCRSSVQVLRIWRINRSPYGSLTINALGVWADIIFKCDYPASLKEFCGEHLEQCAHREKTILKGSVDCFGLNTCAGNLAFFMYRSSAACWFKNETLSQECFCVGIVYNLLCIPLESDTHNGQQSYVKCACLALSVVEFSRGGTSLKR